MDFRVIKKESKGKIAVGLMLVLFLFSFALPVQADLVNLASKENITVKIIATKNFGEEVLFEKKLEVKAGTTAGDALGQVAEIGMSGTYIETINGIKGSQKEYWIYYINGIMSNVFPHGYKMQHGDVMHWDFHDWRFYMHSPMAMLGYYPEPCIQGYKGEVAPTVVVYGEGFQDLGEKLGKKLAVLGVSKPVVKKAEDLSGAEKEKNNVIIVAEAGHPLIKDLNKFYQKSELIYFDQGKIVVRDFGGKDKKNYGAGSGVLQVVQNPWNPKGSFACGSAVWVATGLDEKGVALAAGALINHTSALKNTFALVVQEDKMICAPIGPQGEKTIAIKPVKEDPKKESNKTEPAKSKKPEISPDKVAEQNQENTVESGAKTKDNEAKTASEQGAEGEKVNEEPIAGEKEEDNDASVILDGQVQSDADAVGTDPVAESESKKAEGGNYWWMALVIMAVGGVSTLFLRKKSNSQKPLNK